MMTPRKAPQSLVVALAAVAAGAALAGCGTTVPLASVARAQSGAGVQADQLAAHPGGGATGASALLNPSGGGSGPARPASAATTPTSATDGPSVFAPAVAGTARGKSPISIGFLAADYTQLLATIGAQSPSDPQATWKALVRGLNARGGLAGRRIAPVYFTVDGSQTSYDNQYQAACAAFTQDHHVEAVLLGGNADSSLFDCLLKAGVPVLDADVSEGTDEVDMRRFPNLVLPGGLAMDRQAMALFDGAVRTGWLTSKNKLGLVISGCPWGARTYDSVLVPRARRLGISIDDFATGCAPNGAGTVTQDARAVHSAALKFRTEGVDRVMFLVANETGATYLLFAEEADSQGWHPGYLVGTDAGAEVLAGIGALPKAQAANTHGFGWIPGLDVAVPQATSQSNSCTRLIISAGGAAPSSGAQGVGYWLGCDAMLVLRAALEADGAVGGVRALIPAVDRLAGTYRAAATIGGAVRFAGDRHDGARLVAPFTYQSGCSCFSYSGAPQPQA